jgi:hypothetical protein
MIRAFLSHSSKDKDQYVRGVANWLGKDNVIYDEWTFEEGEKPLDEILKGLDTTELFVLFLSNNALDSEWVKTEVIQAKNKLDSASLAKVFPIIIEDGLTYDDERIPEWLRDNYNLKPIKRAQVAAKRIHNKLRELSWSKHPELKKRQNLFVGRNDKQEEFEERIHDFDKKKPSVIIATGLVGVGRRTFLHKALYKTNITECSHKPSSIFLDRSVSIEDFILKLNDLGLNDFGDRLLNLTTTSMRDKMSMIHEIMDAAYDSKEIIYMVDDGCIVNYERKISGWFEDTISSYHKNDFPIFCLASKYFVNFSSRPRNDSYYFVELNELNPNERKRLLTQLLDLYKLKLSHDDFLAVDGLLCGLPDQIMYAVDLLKDDNLSKVSDKLPVLAQYNSDKASVILQKYEDDEKTLDFIRLLAQFEIISSDFIFSIVPEKEYYPLLEELASEHVCEMIGVDGEIVRLNDVIRDYIKRNKFKVKTSFELLIKEQVSSLVNSEDVFQRDSSEYIFSISEALKEGADIHDSLLIPSHYLRCMKDLYYTKGDLARIIELADIILQKREHMDVGVEQDIRYYLCLALAKKKNKRLLHEVQSIKGDEHAFLLGFYYRLSSRYSDALAQFNKIIDARFVGARSKREIVQVYVQIEEYDKAKEFAKRNYEDNRGNQFHTQAYFNCLINCESPMEHKSELQSLINNFRTINSEQSNEMADICDATYAAKIENDRVKASDLIEDTIHRYPDNHYPLLAYCDIALRYSDTDMLITGINQLEELMKLKSISSRTINRYKAFLSALTGDVNGALLLIESDISRYPPDSREKIKNRLRQCSKIKT